LTNYTYFLLNLLGKSSRGSFSGVGQGFVVPGEVEVWIKIVRQDLNEVFIAIEEAKAF